jgi:hypothetical protein
MLFERFSNFLNRIWRVPVKLRFADCNLPIAASVILQLQESNNGSRLWSTESNFRSQLITPKTVEAEIIYSPDSTTVAPGVPSGTRWTGTPVFEMRKSIEGP